MFAEAQRASGDMDPAYPVLRELLKANLMGGKPTTEDRLWGTLLYLAHYNLSSGLRAWWRYPHWAEEWTADAIAADRFPSGTERRGLRTPDRMAAHLRGLIQRAAGFGGWEAWLTSRGRSWDAIMETVEEAPQNGRWAAFKLAELLQTVHGWEIEAPDIHAGGSTGPLAGLRALYPREEDDWLILAGERLVANSLSYRGVLLRPEELETVLCNWHALSDGRYYVGHDIDEMLESALKAPADVRDAILAARKASLPHEYLGELEDPPRLTMDRERMKAYRDRGEVVTRG